MTGPFIVGTGIGSVFGTWPKGGETPHQMAWRRMKHKQSTHVLLHQVGDLHMIPYLFQIKSSKVPVSSRCLVGVWLLNKQEHPTWSGRGSFDVS